MGDVYANILETLTSGLYNDVKFAVREYLQNAYDSIKQARAENLACSDGSYCVNVEIPKNNAIITISDNGIGMDVGLLSEYTSIGGGTKNSPEYAGHKGIGKLSGLRFFNDFKVISKVVGSTEAFELHWKCGEMMRLVAEKPEEMKRTPYKDFIGKFFTINTIEGEEAERHYTQIQLIGVTEEFKDQVSEERIGQFIKQNCPVPFYAEGFKFAKTLATWLGNDISLIDTFINEKVIYQLYDDDYSLVQPQLVEIRYDDRVRAKVWFSWVHNTAETISDDSIRGIRFRCKGLCVGDSNLFANNCMPSGREQLAHWFTGEVIVLDDDIVPSAARDRFYEGTPVQRLFGELRSRVGKELSSIADLRSEISAAEGDYTSIQKMKGEGQNIPGNRFKRLSERIKQLEKLQRRDKYGFDFNIVEKLKNLLHEEELAADDGIHDSPDDPHNDFSDTTPEAVIDKMLQLKEQEANAFSRNVRAKRQKQIKELKGHLVGLVNHNDDMPFTNSNLSYLVSIFAKYLKIKGYHYDESELRAFLENELPRE